MDQKPWYQKKKMDPAFSFSLSDCPAHNFTLHWHEPIEILYLAKGKMSASLEGNTFSMNEGDIIIVNSGFLHGFYNVSGIDPILYNFQFGLEIFDQALVDLLDGTVRNSIFDRRFLLTRRDDGDVYLKVKAILLAIRKEYYDAKPGFRLAVKAKLFELALVFLREMPKREQVPRLTGKRSYNRAVLERMFSFVHDNYGAAVSLEQAAEAAALSKFYFARFFKEKTGLTFHAYLSKIRVTKAMEYLMETDLLITDIAYQCGFVSLNTFNRRFKQHTGTSPSNYRWGKKTAKRGTVLEYNL